MGTAFCEWFSDVIGIGFGLNMEFGLDKCAKEIF